MKEPKDIQIYEKEFQRRKQIAEAKLLDREFYDIKELYEKMEDVI